MIERTALCGHTYFSAAAGRPRKKCDACTEQAKPVDAKSWWERHGYKDRWSSAFKEDAK